MSSLVNKLRGAGPVHSRGEFTLDADQAGSKLARFQFRDEREFLTHLVAGLYRLGSQSIQVTAQGGQLTVVLEELDLGESVPAELGLHLLEELSPLRRLAAASQAILGHQPDRFEWLGKSKNQKYDYLTDASSNWSGRLCEIQLEGLPAPLIDKAVKELEKQSLYNRRQLKVNGRTLPTPRQPLQPIGQHQGWCHCDPSRDRSELCLVVDEMVTDPKTVSCEIPWSGMVYWDLPQILMDASLASVVEDETYQTLLQSIPETYAPALLALIPQAMAYQGARSRDFLLELLRRPAPAWLDSVYARFTQVEWFHDQNSRRWSLDSLLASPETLYYSATPPPQGLPQSILVEESLAAVLCLQAQLGDRLQEATPVVLQQLRRQANQQRWGEQPETGLQLPSRNWILQKVYPQWALGVPDDWSQPGGTVSLVHQGKFLASRPLQHPEITFELVCEVEESDISPLWDGLTEAAWSRLEPRWIYSLEEMVKELASGHDELGPMRSYLLDHLGKSHKPEDSYFAKTLLFRDWRGEPHSLYSLLRARGEGRRVGTVNPERLPQDYREEWLPEAIYVAAGRPEGKCLSQVKGLDLIDFNPLLDDLKELRTTPPARRSDWSASWESEAFTAHLEVTPDFGEGKIQVVVDGLPLALQTVPSQVGFVASVSGPYFKFRARLDSQRLGPRRFELVHSPSWKRFLEGTPEAISTSLRRRLEDLHSETWQSWVRQAVLQGLAVEHPALAQVACWPTRPQPSSLDELLTASAIHWTGRSPEPQEVEEFASAHPSQGSAKSLFYPGLKTSEQQKLDKAYGGPWICVDAWFEKQDRFKEFLSQPPLRLGYSLTLASMEAESPFKGLLSLVDVEEEQGSLQWLYRGRPVSRESDPCRPGLRSQVECDQLEVNEDFTEVGPLSALRIARQSLGLQMNGLLARWLSKPRPDYAKFCRMWKQWDGLGGEVSQGLRRQPWILCNHGARSFDDLLAVERLYRLPATRRDIPDDITVIFDNRTPQRVLDQLMSKHPNSVNAKNTEKYLQERDRLEAQKATLIEQAKRLKNLTYKVELNPPHEGELALSDKRTKDCWLVQGQRAVAIHNLPSGLLGYVQTEGAKIRKIGSSEQAELSPAASQYIFLALLPLFLRRIDDGNLKTFDREVLAEYCLAVFPLLHSDDPQPPWSQLRDSRWIACADDSLVSLQQLLLEFQEQKQVLYWPKKYLLSSAGGGLTPLISSPILMELLTRWLGAPPVEREKPLLYRDISELTAPKISSLKDVLEGLGRWVRERPGATLTQGLQKVMDGTSHALKARIQGIQERQQEIKERQLEVKKRRQAEAEAARNKARLELEQRQQQLESQGKPLLTAVRRQASLLLKGAARKETMRKLERAQWSTESNPAMWDLSGEAAILFAHHPRLSPWLGPDEPPVQVTLSLLLGLVSAINARSEPFTDAMEMDFLERLVQDVVESYRDLIARI